MSLSYRADRHIKETACVGSCTNKIQPRKKVLQGICKERRAKHLFGTNRTSRSEKVFPRLKNLQLLQLPRKEGEGLTLTFP